MAIRIVTAGAWLIAIVVGLWCLHRLALRAEARGWIRYSKGRGSAAALGNALLEVQSMVEPSARHVLEERRRDAETSEESGDPPAPGGDERVALVPIDRDGTARDGSLALPEVAADVLRATAALYASDGFEEPWIGYLAVRGTAVVGTCGFKSAPRDGRVEIAYFTFPEHEGEGIATAMAAALVAIARRSGRTLTIAAQTLPDRNASHRVLEKLGFERVGTVEHPEDGTVLEWQSPRRPVPCDNRGAARPGRGRAPSKSRGERR